MRFQLAQAGLRPERFGKAASRLRGGSAGPVSDPYAKRINATGWYVEGDVPPGLLNPDAAPRMIYGSTPGFDANGDPISVLVTRILTKQLRQPWPSQATPTNDTALDDYAYQDDVYPGIVNNSLVRSPKPVMNWGRVDRRIVGNSLRVEAVGFHRDARDGGQLACVEFTVTDGTTTLTAKISAMTILAHSGDRNAVIGYAHTFDLSALSDLTTLSVDARGFPKVGVAASIRDSRSGAADSREFRTLRYFKNVAKHTNPPIAVVSSSGVDASGVVSLTEATAAASPFLTLAGAANGLRLATGLTGGFTDGCEIRIADSEVALGTFLAVTFQSQYELTITKLSNVTQSQARIALASSIQWRHSAIRFRDITLNRSGTAQLHSARYVMENCIYANAGIASGILSSSGSPSLYMLGVTITGAGSSNLAAATGCPIAMLRGVDAGTLGSAINVEPWLVLGSNFRSATQTSRGGRTLSGSIVAFNYYAGQLAQWCVIGGDEDIDGCAFVQNCVEDMTAANINMMAPSNDGKTGNVTGLVDHHNTFVGTGLYGRSNFLYNETSGTARTHKLTSSVGHVTPQFNTKHDIFAGANSGLPDASSRTGGWSVMNGVGFVGLFSMFKAANPTSEHPEYPGLNASLGTSDTVRNDPLFIDFKAVTAGPVAGAGGGNYRLQAGSPLIGRTKRWVLPYDLDGNPRGPGGTASGCYERLAA